MKGAREYAGLFKTGQYDKLYIVSGCHARGKMFRIQILPKGVKAIPNGNGNLCLNKDALEVYGVLGGNIGWTEYYGWLHEGKWQDDFKKLVSKAKRLIANRNRKASKIQEQRRLEQEKDAKKLLQAY